MPTDIFDEVAERPSGDVFDQLEPQPKRDIFDEVHQQMEALPRNSDELAVRNFGERQKLAKQIGVPISQEGETPDPVKMLTTSLVRLKPTTRELLESARGFTQGQLSNPAIQTELPPITEANVQQAEKSTGFKIMKGGINAVAGAEEFLTSPLGIATLGTGALPATAQRVIAGVFAADMAKQMPEQFKQLNEAIQSKDPEKITETAGGLGLSALFTTLAAKHAATGGKAAATPLEQKADTIEPVAPLTAEALKPVAETPISEVPKPAQLGEPKSVETPAVSETKAAETPIEATAKVQEHVKEVANIDGPRPAKEIKSELVARLEKAIEDAPSEKDTEQSKALEQLQELKRRLILSNDPVEIDGIKRNGASLYDAWRNKEGIPKNGSWEDSYFESALSRQSRGGKIEINIPGDGKFTVWKTKEALSEVLKRAKKISVSANPIKTFKETGISKADQAWVNEQTAAQNSTDSEKLGAVNGGGSEPFEKPPHEILASAKKIKITAPNGATQIRITTTDGKSSIQPIATLNKFNAFQGVDISKIEAGTIGKDKQFKPVAGDVAVMDKSPISEGPGAASPGDVPQNSELSQLTESIVKGVPKDASLPEQVSAINRATAGLSDAKDAVLGSLAKAKAVGDAVWSKYTELPKYQDEQRSVGKWTYANQKADFEARRFQKSIEKAIPNKLRREAITNWIQADGDASVIRARAAASRGRIRQGYEAALTLNDYEVTVGENIRSYLESQLQKGIEGDILQNGVENYLNQVWKRENPVTRSIVNDFQASKLQPNFRFAKKRIFDSYFEGEQAGYKPANKDVGALIALYDQAFNKTLSARAFLRDLNTGAASDGRPLVEVSGSGKLIEGEGDPKILIKQRTKPEELWDYKTIPHPAMNGWKWLTNDSNGKPVLYEGQLLVHPEAYGKLFNRLTRSKWQTAEVGGIRPGAALLQAQSALKQTMLSISGFHQAQETIHAFGHRFGLDSIKQSAHDFIQSVSGKDVPWLDKLESLDFDNPIKKDLISHGLQVADYHAMSDFGEGLASGALTNKIPWIGNKILKPYTEWLFQDYIPRLKMTLAVRANERNMAAFKNELDSGKITRDQILELSAKQANAAFGELNYKYMGRNPTLQDTMRAFLLAPDFLEARAKFVGQGLKPYGREQLIALGLLAATQYITARIWNKTLDDDYHWNKPFSYIYKEKEYGIRTVPGDIAHLISDRRKFFYNRLSPILGRGGIELVTGRDDRGVKRDAMDQVKDMAKSGMPISLRVRDDVRLWESFLNSFGMHERRFSAVSEIGDMARQWVKENKPQSAFESTYDPEKDAYRSLRLALANQDQSEAQKAYDELKKSNQPIKIKENIKGYYTHPLTGSFDNETAFKKTLDAHGKGRYEEAQKERRSSLSLFDKLKK